VGLGRLCLLLFAGCIRFHAAGQEFVKFETQCSEISRSNGALERLDFDKIKTGVLLWTRKNRVERETYGRMGRQSEAMQTPSRV